MDDQRIDRWLGIVGNVAVVIGLIIVAVELRQSSSIANGELAAQFFRDIQDLERSRQDSDFARVYAKSIEDPDELTLAELVQLDGYYNVLLAQISSARRLVELGLFQQNYEYIVRANVRDVLYTPFSHIWWRSVAEDWADRETLDFINDELDQMDLSEPTYLEAMMAKLGSLSL